MNTYQAQNQVEKLKKDKEKLIQRQGELLTDLEEKKKEVLSKNERISQLLIDGKSTKQLADESTVDQTFLKNIENAIGAIDHKLQEIEEQIKYENSVGLRIEFEEGIKKLNPEVKKLFDQMNLLLKEIEPHLKTFARLDDIAKNRVYPRIRLSTHTDYYKVYVLAAMIDGYGGIRHRLQEIEKTFSERR